VPPAIDLRQHLQHVANLPSAEYTVGSYSPPTDAPLGLAIAQGRLFGPAAYVFWHMLLLDDDLPPVQFNWRAVSLYHPRRTMVVVHSGGTPEALMQIDERHVVRDLASRRGPLVYITFLEVAPWNKTESPRRHFRGLGQLLVRFAYQRSRALGYNGAVGLHSVLTAEGFYERLGFERHHCPNEYHEAYFELSEDAAQRNGWTRD
jgi:GNAT superfamily N-acetyltransferase